MQVQWFGQSAFALSDGTRRLVVDPWFDGNPAAGLKWTEVEADTIVLTHGHADHYGDTVRIAKRTGATVIAQTEIAGELEGEGLAKVVGPNLGGTVNFDGGWVQLVPALHSSTTPKGTVSVAAGAVIHFGDLTIYHLGDTALFSDLALPGRRHKLDAAIVPIGGFYTMDRIDAVEAVRLVRAPLIIPCHYNTFPLIAADPEAFAADVAQKVPGTRVAVLQPGETTTLPS